MSGASLLTTEAQFGMQIESSQTRLMGQSLIVFARQETRHTKPPKQIPSPSASPPSTLLEQLLPKLLQT